jgi:hypothetical protein
VLVLAAVATVPLLLAILVLTQQFAQVDPSQISAGVIRSSQPLGLWALGSMLYVVLAMLLLAGLPEKRGWSAPGTWRGAIAQGIGGLVVACEAWLVSHVHFYFMGPGEGCTYPSCWPLDQQTAAVAAPGVIAGLSMTVMAFFVTRLSWWVRATVPVMVLVVALGILYAVWDRYLLPLFQAPPPA